MGSHLAELGVYLPTSSEHLDSVEILEKIVAEERKYLLPDPDRSGDPKWYHYLHFGQCTVNPEYSGQKLWFVTVPQGTNTHLHHEYDEYEDPETGFTHVEYYWPDVETTFLVPEKYVNVESFLARRRNTRKWSQVAVKKVVGKWNAEQECLWSDRQIGYLELPNGSKIKYGRCFAQPDDPSRRLKFVAIRSNADHLFLVDEELATPEVISIFGDDWKNGWIKICWCYLGQEVDWDLVGSSKDPVSWSRWHFDSPYTPDSVADALAFVEDYKNGKRAGPAPRSRGFNI
jgi:hypothetical protein